MRIIGLTGGTGSGKSEAARRFEDRNIPAIDADEIGHEVIAPGGQTVDTVVAAFGEDILTDGIIDRVKLGARVFDDPEALRRLNALVHPWIGVVIAQRCSEYAQAGRTVAIVDAALLAERGRREEWLDGLILVTAKQAIRQQRLVQYRGMTPDQALQRIQAQTSPETKIPLADWIIENNGGIDELHRRVDEVAAQILKDEG